METAPAVVVAGHVCLDEIVTARGTALAVGSPAAFIAPVLAEAGIDTTVAAPHGSDFDALHPGLHLLEPTRGDRTLVFVNDVRGEHREQSVREADAARLGPPGPAALEALGRASALMLTPLIPDPSVAGVRRYIEALPPSALRVVLLQGYLREVSEHPDAQGRRSVHERPLAEADALLPLFDVAVLSDEDLAGDVDRTASGWSRAHPDTAVVVTRGAEGASVYLAGERRDRPAHPIGRPAGEALVGAGDTFSAELTAALLSAAGPARARSAAHALPALERALEQANRATALRLAGASRGH